MRYSIYPSSSFKPALPTFTPLKISPENSSLHVALFVFELVIDYHQNLLEHPDCLQVNDKSDRDDLRHENKITDEEEDALVTFNPDIVLKVDPILKISRF